MRLVLGESEFRALHALIRMINMAYPMEYLKEHQYDYLAISSLEELHEKLECRALKARKYGFGKKKFNLALKRHEAVSLLIVLGGERNIDSESFLPALEDTSYELLMVNTLTAEINKEYFV